ncbi:hypothetical protein [Mangrovibacterium marinum]|uniref:Uncharacterized protein n=1 Tax=Mangrovibacterium marinum TaxID=1639118 RepID=A0A2T5C3R0_9BACT|nr:hypothetical protein [Mangrovibacterium marinum]PTN09375.1 hypothetical protein C8N47_105216 [Mangrovibacterium marinum]
MTNMKAMKDFDDLLEKTIRENKAFFDEDAPEGHFERFAQRLNAPRIDPIRRRRKIFLQVAATVAFVLLLGNQLRMYLQQPQPEAAITLGSVAPEYAEAEFYYTSAIDQGMRHWEKLSEDGIISTDEQRMMQEEIADFEETYARLQDELAANPEDERVINAMLELYQTRLAIINLIIEKLEEVKKQKTYNHDESEI